MRSRLILALAASVVSVGGLTLAAPVFAKAEDGTQRAAEQMAKAERELALDKTERAVKYAERAVEAAPLSVEARALLARTYLADGRLTSAQAAYGDVLTLAPGDPTATLNLALVRTALGDRTGAHALLMGSGGLSDADRGLGLVLTGDLAGGVRTLTQAARGPEADGRLRQNLAFAYAMAGDWRQARVVASQDLAPAMVHQRIGEWSQVARPRNSWDQVAYLLNIQPVEDAGMPQGLALNLPAARAASTALAQAEPVVERPAVIAPVAVAELPSRSEVAVVASEPAIVFQRQAVVQPLPMAQAAPAVPTTMLARSAPVPPPPLMLARAAPAAPAPMLARAAPPAAPSGRLQPASTTVRAPSSRFTSGGRFVVQLAAYVTPGAAETGWMRAQRRYDLDGATPLASKATVGGRQFTRLAAGHFTTRAEATAVCRSVKSDGGECFVREVRGDDLPHWAKRAGSGRVASR